MAKSAAPKAKTAVIHAVVGSDESEVKRAAAVLAEKLMPASAGEFGREVIDGVAENVDQAVSRIHLTADAILTLPFFGGQKLVWLKNASFLRDDVMGRSASVIEALDHLTALLSAGLPEGVQFLLSAPEIDKRRSFYKTIGKLGVVEVHDKADTGRSGWEEQAAGTIESKAQARGFRFSNDALELFVLFTGGESRLVENEIEKLDLFLGQSRRTVTEEDVRRLTPVSRGGVIFELGNALARRDAAGCLSLVEQLLAQGETPIGILLVAIIPTIRNLLVVKDLMDRHRLRPPTAPFHFSTTLARLPPDAVAHLPRKKDGTVNAYSLGIAAIHAYRFELGELREALEASLRANIQLVTTQLAPRVVLTELMMRVAMRGSNRAGNILKNKKPSSIQ
jgi:DNA polymerase-3 subunit delta